MTAIPKEKLETMYWTLKMSDREIAQELKLSRSYISELRKKYSIPTRMSTGRKGELSVIQQLNRLGFSVKDMNLVNKKSDYDVLVNNRIRIEVKSSSAGKRNYSFRLADNRLREHLVSHNRIKLENGNTKKLFEKTCDYIIFVGLNPNKRDESWIIPSIALDRELQGIDLPVNQNFESQYNRFYEKWNQLFT